MKNIINKLLIIQKELKAPKNQRNNFWNYNYRSCEDILEAVKPLLNKEWLVLCISDDIVNIWWYNYIQATAILYFEDEKIETKALAKEPLEQKWMSSSQITGASSSYARKYALNWLFAIDDEKDSDSTNTHWKETKKEVKTETKEVKKWLNYETFKEIIEAWNTTEQDIAKIIQEDWYTLSNQARIAVRYYCDTWEIDKNLFFKK